MLATQSHVEIKIIPGPHFFGEGSHRWKGLQVGEKPRFKWLILLGVSFVGLFLDIYTKFLASTKLPFGRPIPIIGEFLQFLLVYNKAAIFGLDPRKVIPGFPLETFFLVFNAIAILLLLAYFWSLHKDKILQWGLALIVPGALGNLSDRVLYPRRGVVDFIRVGVSETIYWPIFNFADIYVTVGVGLILLSYIREELRRARDKRQSESGASDTAPIGPPTT